MHIHETNLTLEEGTFNILLGTTLAGKTTLMQLMAGLDKPTSGEIWFRRQERDRRPGAEAQRLDGLSAVHQLSESHRLREHRLAAARRSASTRPRSSERVGSVAELLRLTPMLERQARRALRRPAAAHGDRARARQGFRSHPARRAARQSRLQAARGNARRAAAAVRTTAHCIVVYATTEPAEALLFGGNTATLHEGRVTQFGQTAEIYRRPDRPR